jgi:hypothetical protein
MKKELLKEFSEWLNEEDRNNWEIERYVEAMLDTFEEHITKAHYKGLWIRIPFRGSSISIHYQY